MLLFGTFFLPQVADGCMHRSHALCNASRNASEFCSAFLATSFSPSVVCHLCAACSPRPTRKGLKRKYLAPEDALSDELTDDEGVTPRRSTRAKVQPTNGSKSAEEERRTEGNPPKVGAAFQVSVPPAVIPERDRRPDMVDVASELVYSPSLCVNEERTAQLLERVNAFLCRRDGFPLSPRGQETVLRMLAQKRGQVVAACEAVLPLVGRGVEFPGAGTGWTNDEKCRYVRAVGETNKNFSLISRTALKNRSTNELVVMYYTYYKQQKLQHGRPSGGLIFDVGTERPYLSRLGPERIAYGLKNLARTAGDGFPADRRMAESVFQYRTLVRSSKQEEARKRRNSTSRVG